MRDGHKPRHFGERAPTPQVGAPAFDGSGTREEPQYYLAANSHSPPRGDEKAPAYGISLLPRLSSMDIIRAHMRRAHTPRRFYGTCYLADAAFHNAYYYAANI